MFLCMYAGMYACIYICIYTLDPRESAVDCWTSLKGIKAKMIIILASIYVYLYVCTFVCLCVCIYSLLTRANPLLIAYNFSQGHQRKNDDHV